MTNAPMALVINTARIAAALEKQNEILERIDTNLERARLKKSTDGVLLVDVRQ